MASERTPDQLSIVLNSIDGIKDPSARRDALRSLQSEIIQAGASADADQNSPYASNDYAGLLQAVQSGITQAGQDMRDASPTPRTPEQLVVDKANAANAAELQRQRDANQAAGKGYYTDAEVATLGLANQKVSLAQEQAQLAADRQAQDNYIAQQRLLVEQGKLDAQTATQNVQAMIDQQKVNQAQNNAAETHRANNLTAANNFLQNEVTQSNNLADNATSVFNNAGSMAMDVAKGGGTPAQIGGVLGGLLGLAPSFQNQMGGNSVGFGADDFKKVLDLVNSGAVPPDANGNVVPNAIKAVAAGSQPITAPPAGSPAGNPAVGGTMGPNGFQPGSGGLGSNLVTFAAPAG